MRRVEVKKIMKKNQVIITSLAILIAVAGYLNFADVDLGFKDKEASTDSSSILDDVNYDLTDETALLDEKPYLPVRRILRRRRKSVENRCALRTRRTCRRSSAIRISAMKKNRMPSIPWFP